MTSVSHQGFLGWGGGLGGGYVFYLWLCDMERGGPGNKQTKKWGGGWLPKNCTGKKKLKSP